MADFSPFETLKPEPSVSETTNQRMPEKRKVRHGMDVADMALLGGSFIPGPAGAVSSVLGTGKEISDYATGERDDLSPLDLFLSTASLPLSVFGAGGFSKAAKSAEALNAGKKAEKGLEVAKTVDEAKKALGEGMSYLDEAAVNRAKEALSIGDKGADWDQIKKGLRADIVDNMIRNRNKAEGTLTDGLYQQMVSNADKIAQQEVEKLMQGSTTYNRIGKTNEIVTETPKVYGSKYSDLTPESDALTTALRNQGLTSTGTKLVNKFDAMDPEGAFEAYRMLKQKADLANKARTAGMSKGFGEQVAGGVLKGSSNVDQDDLPYMNK